MPYDTVFEALAGDRKASQNYLSLRGIWKFHLADKPEDKIDTFFEDADIVYQISENHYLGNTEVQLQLSDIKPSEK